MVALISPPAVFSPSPHGHPERERHLQLVPQAPDFLIGRQIASAVPSMRPTLLRLDAVVDALRWGGSSALRFGLLALAMTMAVVGVRMAQGMPPESGSAPVAEATSPAQSAGFGDVVLSVQTGR